VGETGIQARRCSGPVLSARQAGTETACLSTILCLETFLRRSVVQEMKCFWLRIAALRVLKYMFFVMASSMLESVHWWREPRSAGRKDPIARAFERCVAPVMY